ncbi:PQQ-binding-like beta-propeller repeat protein [Mesohalobacter halotolerans]|nr:PQQ-binding-like beta-propeller repeat protein [Mesohalobacter halotolerans]
MNRILIFIIFILSSFTSTAQNKIDIKGKVKAKIINQQNSNLLVATSKATYGIDPQTQHLKWTTKKLKKVIYKSYMELGESSLILLEKKPLINSKFLSKLFNTKGASFIILDTDTGEIFFDSTRLNYKSIFNLEYFPKDKSILFTGIKHKSFFLYHLKLTDKAKNWEVKLADNKFIKAAKRQLIGNDNLIPNQNGNIFWVLDNQLRVFNAKNGQVTSEINNVKDIDYEPNSDILITYKENINVSKANKETLISAYLSGDMSLLWEQPVKVFGKIKKSILVDGRLIVITQTGFDVISLKTGQKQWEKSESLPLLEDVIPTVNNQYFVIQDQFFFKIDSTGQKAWKNPIKIFKSDDRGLYFIKQQRKYVLSITPSFIHKINSNTGELIGESPKTLNTSSFAERGLKLFNNRYHVWFDSVENTFLIFSNSRLYRTKVEEKLQPQLIFTFEEKSVPQFERRSNGYFFRQNNHFVYLDEEGHKIYDTTSSKIVKPSLINTTQSLGKQGYRIYSATLGFIPKQIDNAFKSVLVSTNVGVLNRSSAFVYGNYHNYTTLYDDFTSLPQVDVGSYLEDDFKTSKKGKIDKNTYVFVTYEEEKLYFKSLNKETGQIVNLKSTPLKSTDIMIDQALKIAYVFFKDHIEIYGLN